jgi:hypothetical protein
MAKLRTPTHDDEIDHYGPNARARRLVERDHVEGTRKVVTVRLIIPTTELVRIARKTITRTK